MTTPSAQSRSKLTPLPRPRSRKERRTSRSEEPGRALRMALSNGANRGGLVALILADDAGMLVARADGELDLSMLAAVTPIVGRGRAQARVRREGREIDLTVRPVTVADEVMYVAALGGKRNDRQREVASAVAAARRILA